MNVESKVVINNNIIEQVNSFNYLGFTITVSNNRDLEIEMRRLNQKCSTIRITLNNKTGQEIKIKFNEAMAVPILTYGSEIWTVTPPKKTRSKNVNCRNEFLEECSRLHKDGLNKKYYN
jgi:hypothetical protein